MAKKAKGRQSHVSLIEPVLLLQARHKQCLLVVLRDCAEAGFRELDARMRNDQPSNSR